MGWDTKCDLDASIILLDKLGNLVDMVFYGKKRSDDGAIIHSGDNLTGEGEGDDETIRIFLNKVNPNIDSIWPVINVYTAGQQFDDVKGAYCRLMDNQCENSVDITFQKIGII